MTQLTWHLRGSVCQRFRLEVVKFTWRVDPSGLYGSRITVGLRSEWARVMADMIFSHAMSANTSYMSCAGKVPPSHTRHSCSHWRVMRFSWQKRCSFGSPLGSLQRV